MQNKSLNYYATLDFQVSVYMESLILMLPSTKKTRTPLVTYQQHFPIEVVGKHSFKDRYILLKDI